MNPAYHIRLLDSVDEHVLDQIELQLLDMYAYMSDHGLQMPLAEGGEKKWRVGVERTLGRLGALVVAEAGDKVVGFIRGVVRLAPDHLGGGKIGFVDHTFVDESMRGQGVGRAMFETLQSWFQSKGVQQLELQVLCGNRPAIEAWQAMGFQPELLQMRKLID